MKSPVTMEIGGGHRTRVVHINRVASCVRVISSFVLSLDKVLHEQLPRVYHLGLVSNYQV